MANNGFIKNQRAPLAQVGGSILSEVGALVDGNNGNQSMIGGQVLAPSIDGSCPQEQRQVNNNTGAAINSGAGGALVKIFTRPSGGTTEVIEISMQTEQDTHIQLFEGNFPITATRFVQANLLWSTPGKVINADIFALITEASALVDTDVRYIVR